MSASEQERSRFFPFGDPKPFRVGSITKRAKELGSGVHPVAEHKGTVLWAHIVDGKGIDFRCFDKDGKELGIVIFKEPDTRLGPPTAQNLRPLKEPNSGVVPLDDGGSRGCAWICGTADAGCYQQC